jgi:hypothetical protein
MWLALVCTAQSNDCQKCERRITVEKVICVLYANWQDDKVGWDDERMRKVALAATMNEPAISGCSPGVGQA